MFFQDKLSKNNLEAQGKEMTQEEIKVSSEKEEVFSSVLKEKLKSAKAFLTKPLTKKNKDENNAKKEEKSFQAASHLNIDVYRSPSEIIIYAPVYGAGPEDIDIFVEGESDILTIEGKSRKPEQYSEEEKKEGKYLFKECKWDKFYRQINLNEEINASKISAELENGILTLILPLLKAGDERSRSIKRKIAVSQVYSKEGKPALQDKRDSDYDKFRASKSRGPSAKSESRELTDIVEKSFAQKLTASQDEKDYKITAYWTNNRKEEEKKAETEPSGASFKKKKKIAVFCAFALVFCAAIFYLAFFILPRAKITATRKQIPYDYEINLSVSKNIIIPNLEENNWRVPVKTKIPNERMASEQFKATGKQHGESKAKGKILIYNGYGSAPQTLVATTRFLSSDGKLFRLDKKTVVPGAKIVGSKITPSYIEAEATADQPGPEYNIAPSKFTIPGFKGTPRYEGFYGESKEKFKGGAKGETTVVSEEDIVKAKTALSNALETLLKEEFKSTIPQDYFFSEKTENFKITAFEADAESGEPKENFRINIKAELSVATFLKSDLEMIAKDIIKNRTENFQNFDIKSIDYEFGDGRLDEKGQFISFPLRIKAMLALKIEEGKIKEAVSGKDKGEIKNVILGMPQIDSAKLNLWPFWVWSAPKNNDKIEVVIL